MFNQHYFQQKVVNLTAKSKFLVAYSGGMDSHVLLFCAAQLRRLNSAITVRAVHVHHGLSSNADGWAEHCRQVCQQLKIELEIVNVDVTARRQHHSLEAVARELRYQALAQLLQQDEVLLTAHHADDQAETLLLQLFRGAGVAGLAAMPPNREFVSSELLRPLLYVPREELLEFAQNHNLRWIEDESNEDIGFDRNYVRHRLLPEIEGRWPSMVQALERVAINCAEANELLEILAEQDLMLSRGSASNTLSVTNLLQFSEARRHNLLRYWLRQQHLPLPSRKKLLQIEHDVLQCRVDAQPVVSWLGTEIRRYRNDLYAMVPLASFDHDQIIVWDGVSELQLPQGLGLLRPEVLARCKVLVEAGMYFEVRFRTNGLGKKLKKLLQAAAIPPWWRDRTPLLYMNERLMLVLTPELLL